MLRLANRERGPALTIYLRKSGSWPPRTTRKAGKQMQPVDNFGELQC